MKIIQGDYAILEKLYKADLIRDLEEYGILILRNFKVDLARFSHFIGTICSRVTSDPARKSSAENAQLIDAGEMELGLHLENGNAPFMPDLQFFYCEKAPSKLSRTTYCDGYEAYKLLEPIIASHLLDKQIMYTRNIDNIKWKKYFSTELQREIKFLSDITPFLPHDVQIIEKENGYIQWRIRRSIVYKSLLSKKYVLAHCVYGPSINYDIPQVTWSDGSLIKPEILNHIGSIGDRLTKPIPYSDGDVVIDNHRVMHGREKIVDLSRKIFVGQGYL